MSAAKTVQIRTKEDLLSAYESWKHPLFSITQGNRQFFFKYEGSDLDEGSDMLDQFLEMLDTTAGIYTLNVFNSMPSGGRITIKSLADGSINFQFREKPNSYAPPDIYQESGKNMREIYQEYGRLKETEKQLLTENLQMKQEIADLEQELDDMDKKLSGLEKKPDGIMGMIEDFKPLIAVKLASLLGIDMASANAAKIAGIPGMQPAPDAALSPEQMMSEGLKILYEAEPEFHAVLYKMAMMAKKQPDSFKFYMSQLKQMNF